MGDINSNSHGGVIEDLLANSDICVINNGQSTHLHKQTNSESCVDMTIVSPDIYADLEWRVDPDLHGSDHFPCYVSFISIQRGELLKSIRYKLDKADWTLYKQCTEIKEDTYKFMEDIDEHG